MAASKRCPLGDSLKSWIASLAILGAFLCNGMIISIQTNISDEVVVKPRKLKDISMTHYGIFFGIFKLTVFMSSTMFGKYLSSFGVRKVFLGGLVMTGSTTMMFALLTQTSFNSLLHAETLVSILVATRIMGAAGTTAFLTASFTIVGDLFCQSVGTVFAVEQMCLAIGMLCGKLYSTHTFFTIQLLGFVLIVFAFITSLTLPSIKNSTDQELDRQFGITTALKKPTIALSALSVFSASIAIGTLHTAADQHLTDQIHLTTPQVKYFFMMYFLACAMVTPCWGLLSDKLDPKYVILLGSFQTSLGFVLLGPLPVTGLTASHSLSLVSVVLAGSGIGAQLVAAFTEVQRSAVDNGFPAEISTAFLMSSIWTAAFALGAFIGPVAAGVLFDHVGFAWSTLFVVGWNIMVCVRSAQCLPSTLQNQDIKNQFNEEKIYLLDKRNLQRKYYENL